ncbi:hypothetical protein [Streptomyces sp. NPDC001851]|uniref:hypothetical protein n=1 Tax=Streptomyces sp. NPDC001851 TaxID=3154529 RepID=UPI0033225E5B
MAVVSAKRLGAGLADRAVQGLEQSVAARLGRLYRWIAGRLPGEEGATLVEEAGRSPAAQALLRRRLVLALGEDPAGVEELRRLLPPYASARGFRLARLYGAAGKHHDVLDVLQQSRTHHRAAGMPFPDLADIELSRALTRPAPRARRFRRHQ